MVSRESKKGISNLIKNYDTLFVYNAYTLSGTWSRRAFPTVIGVHEGGEEIWYVEIGDLVS